MKKPLYANIGTLITILKSSEGAHKKMKIFLVIPNLMSIKLQTFFFIWLRVISLPNKLWSLHAWSVLRNSHKTAARKISPRLRSMCTRCRSILNLSLPDCTLLPWDFPSTDPKGLRPGDLQGQVSYNEAIVRTVITFGLWHSASS